METEIRNNNEHPGTHDLLVDGRVEVEAESWPVVYNVRHSLEYPGLAALAEVRSEADEIADGIRMRIAQ